MVGEGPAQAADAASAAHPTVIAPTHPALAKHWASNGTRPRLDDIPELVVRLLGAPHAATTKT